MNSTIEFLNACGSQFLNFALPMLWQSSLLIIVVFAVDLLLRRKVRALVRYALWSAVLIKLLLPPTLALPTGAAWWLRTHKTTSALPATKVLVVTQDGPVIPTVPLLQFDRLTPLPAPTLWREGWTLLISTGVSLLLFGWLVFRWRQVARCVRRTEAPTAALDELLERTRLQAGLRRKAVLRLTSDSISPAVCGLFRPVILLPKALVETLPDEQLRAVLLHELIHLRRRDIWMNCVQTMLQIAYWWHPLLWIANARVRRVREEAVDDAVMCALNDKAEIYAPTLIEVARLAFPRPLASLGLVGILESRSALRHRIERLLNFTTPRRAGLSLVSILCITAFTALAVPMGEAPEKDITIDQQNIVETHRSPQQPDAQPAGADTNDSQASTMNSDDGDRSNVVYTNAARKKIYEKLNDIRFDKISFNQMTLAEAVRTLADLSQQRDPKQEGLNLIIDRHRAAPPATPQFDPTTGQPIASQPTPESPDLRSVKIQVPGDLENVRLMDVLEAITKNANRPIKYSIMDYGIEFSSNDPSVPRLFTRTFMFDTAWARNAFNFKLQATNAQQQNNVVDVQKKVLNFFTAEGVSITPPKTVFYNLLQGTLTAHATREDLDKIGQLLSNDATLNSAITNGVTVSNKIDAAVQLKPQLRDAKMLFDMGKLDNAKAALEEVLARDPNDPAALYYLGLIEQNRAKASVDELNKPAPMAMQIPNVEVGNSPESQKIANKLNTIKFDTIYYPNLSLEEVMADLKKQVQLRDPDHKGINIVPVLSLTPQGYLFAPNVPPGKNLNTIKINLPELRDVRLVDVLDAIVKTADYPIQYSISDYGIAFSFKEPEQKLRTRTFKVDPNTFLTGLKNIGELPKGTPSGNGSSQPQAGDMKRVAAEARGLRYVSGSDPTMEIQLAVVNFFNAVGVNLAPPKSVFFNDRVGTLTVHATEQDLDLIEQAIGALNVAPPEVTIKARFVEIDPRSGGVEAVLKSILTNKTDVVDGETPALTGILTEPQFKTVLQSLQKRDHADLLNEGEVTTLTGRQAQLQIVDVQTVVSDFKTTVTTNSTVRGYDTTNMPFGVTLDLAPTVLPDGKSISVMVTPKITEFLGYDNPPKSLVSANKDLQYGQLPLPKYRQRQATANVEVSDGQTIVIGNLSDEMVFQGASGIQMHQPFQMNQPLKDTKKKQLVVFITPTIIDPSGNRVHVAKAK